MRRLLLLVSLALMATLVVAAPVLAAPVASGVSIVGGSSSATARGVTPLADGSWVNVGEFAGIARFGSTTLVAQGAEDGYVARLAADGSWVSLVHMAGTAGSYVYPTEAAVLDDGSMIVVGDLFGTITLGSSTLTAPRTSIFVAKLSADGTWAWAVAVGSSTGTSYAYAVAAFPDGSALVGGEFEGSATFGTTSLTATGPSGGFYARISTSGTWVWADEVDLGDDARVRDVTVRPDGRAAIVGQLKSPFLPSTTAFYGFVSTADANGSAVETLFLGSDVAGSETDVRGVAAAQDGSLMITGALQGSGPFNFDPFSVTPTAQRVSFVAKVRPDLSAFDWARMAGAPSGLPAAQGNSIAVRHDGSALVAGDFDGTIEFGSVTTLTAIGSNAAFVARIGADGVWEWARGGTGTGSADASRIGVQPDGQVLAAGGFSGVVDFGRGDVTSEGGRDGFAWSLVDTPGAPSTPSAVAGVESATVSWPTLGPVITSYAVTASPGGATCTATAPATSCVVVGLAGGTPYTFTVRAANVAGTGPTSTASRSVTPLASNEFQLLGFRRTGAFAFTTRVRLSRPGVVTQSATRARPDARSRAWVCSARAEVEAAGVVTLRCRVNAATRRILRERPLRLQVRVIFTPTAGAAARKTRTVVLPRFVPKPRPVTG